MSAQREGWAAHLRGGGVCAPAQALAKGRSKGRSRTRPEQPTPRGVVFTRRHLAAPGPMALQLGDPMGRWGAKPGVVLPRGIARKNTYLTRQGRSVGGFEWGPAQLGKCIAFLLPGIGRACARVDQLRSPFLDGAAPNDRRIPDRPGLRARTGRKTLAQACRS